MEKTGIVLFAALLCVVLHADCAAGGAEPYRSQMMTAWGEKVTPANAWRGHPRPQMMRERWMSLNGEWNYAVTGEEDGIPERFDGKILVPFPAPSALSGVRRWIASTNALWYSRMVDLHPKRGERTLFHIDGADFRSQVFVNGVEATDTPHQSAQLAFTVDITPFAREGANRIDIQVWDPMNFSKSDKTRWIGNSTGKQTYSPSGCHYTGFTGIWAPVWIETVPDTHVRGYRATPDLDRGCVRIEVDGVGDVKSARCVVRARFGGEEVVSAELKRWGEVLEMPLPKPVREWSPDSPNLYDLEISLGEDVVHGYFGMRKFEVRKDANGVLRFFLNNRFIYPIGTLDQGWWPDGLVTPPSDEAMSWDILFLKRLGFNMMRKHIKVEPMRYYHLCDRLGILVFQDMPSGYGDLNGRYGPYRDELKGMIDQLYNVPSIVMWIPYNERWGQPKAAQTGWTLKWVKRYDPSRVVDGPSGWSDYEGGFIKSTDGKGTLTATSHLPLGTPESAEVIDFHQYPHPRVLPANPHRATMCGEFGGLGLRVDGHVWNPEMRNWGYGGTGTDGRETTVAVQSTYLGLMDELCAMVLFEGCAASVYTQTTDVEGEINGLVTYDRKVEKFAAAALKAAHRKVCEFAATGAGHLSRRDVVMPAFTHSPALWTYSFGAVPPDWTSPGFDDSAWRHSPGGFGSKSIFNANKDARIGAEWRTSELYIRTRFDAPARDFDFAVLSVFHDEDVKVFLNGELIFKESGYTKDYVCHLVDGANLRALLMPKGNVLAACAIQRNGAQYLDVALSTAKVANPER